MPRWKKKNPAAQEIGRLGGLKNSPAQQAARARKGRPGGRPPEYRIEERGPAVAVHHKDRRTADGWRQMHRLTPRALDVLAEWMRAHKPGAAVSWFEDGVAYFEDKE